MPARYPADGAIHLEDADEIRLDEPDDATVRDLPVEG
jgi:hypothetical protein